MERSRQFSIRLFFALSLAIFLSFPKSCTAQQEEYFFDSLKDEIVKTLVNRFHTSLTEYLEIQIKPNEVKSELQKLKYKVDSVNGKELETAFAGGLQHLLDDKRKVLEVIKEEAELAEQAHKHNPDLDRQPYFNMRDIGKTYDYNTTVKIVPTFSDTTPINLTDSFVQVPTNVFAYKSEVLNQVSWGKKLDKNFTENFNKSNGTLLYQYFGDASTGKNIYLYICFP